MVKKYNIGVFVNKGTPEVPDWLRVCKSTALTVNMNPVTVDRDYICDEHPTTEVTDYKPSMSHPLTMYKGNPDYEYFFGKYYNRATDADAETELLLVHYLEEDPVDTFKAEKCNAAVVVRDMNGVDSVINVDLMFNGTSTQGTVVVTGGVPVFTAATGASELTATITVRDGGSNVNAATVSINGVEKISASNGTVTFSLVEGVSYNIGAVKGAKSGAIVSGAISSTNNTFQVDIA